MTASANGRTPPPPSRWPSRAPETVASGFEPRDREPEARSGAANACSRASEGDARSSVRRARALCSRNARANKRCRHPGSGKTCLIDRWRHRWLGNAWPSERRPYLWVRNACLGERQQHRCLRRTCLSQRQQRRWFRHTCLNERQQHLWFRHARLGERHQYLWFGNQWASRR
jgi:hypothetical protein